MNTKLPAKCARCGMEIMADKRCLKRTFCSKCKIEAHRENNTRYKREYRLSNKHLSDRKCIVCGKFLSACSNNKKFCCIECYRKYKNEKKESALQNWLRTGEGGTYVYQPSKMVRKYMYELYNGKCQICGWGEINKHTGKSPLQLRHLDGNSSNNKLENLQLLCPNCHSLTENFGSRNRKAPSGKSSYFGSSKKKRRRKKLALTYTPR